MVLQEETDDDKPIVHNPRGHISLMRSFRTYTLREERNSQRDSLVIIRNNLVPAGYKPYPWHPNVKEHEEACLDMLRTIVATFQFRAKIQELHKE